MASRPAVSPAPPTTAFVGFAEPSRLVRVVRAQRSVLIAYAVLLIVLAVYVAVQPGALSLAELNIQTAAALALVLVAAGQTIVMVAGGIDLSVGGVVSLATCLAATQLDGGTGSIVLWSLAIVAVGLVAGAANGAVVAYVGVAPFVVTLATWSILSGIALLVLETPGGELPVGFVDGLTGSVGSVAVPVLILAALIAVWLWARQTRTLSRLRAVGSDAASAHLAGMAVARYTVLAYVLSGGLAALGGLFLATQLGAGDPTVGGSFVLDSVAAAVIGGASLAGGRGDVLGAVAGAFVLTLVGSLVFVLELPTWSQTIAVGLLLLAVALWGGLSELRGERGEAA